MFREWQWRAEFFTFSITVPQTRCSPGTPDPEVHYTKFLSHSWLQRPLFCISESKYIADKWMYQTYYPTHLCQRLCIYLVTYYIPTRCHAQSHRGEREIQHLPLEQRWSSGRVKQASRETYGAQEAMKWNGTGQERSLRCPGGPRACPTSDVTSHGCQTRVPRKRDGRGNYGEGCMPGRKRNVTPGPGRLHRRGIPQVPACLL